MSSRFPNPVVVQLDYGDWRFILGVLATLVNGIPAQGPIGRLRDQVERKE